MQMWFETISWIAVALGLGSAFLIAADIVLLRRRQQMAVMNVVHPVTALYLGPVWLWLYVARGRRMSERRIGREAERLAERGVDPVIVRRDGASTADEDVRPWHVANAVSHCGAGCTLGDIAGEWFLFAIGAPSLALLGTFGWEVAVDFVFAWTLGVAFQYFTIVPMRADLGRTRGIWQAVKVDSVSILAFQVGLFGFMALSHFVLFDPPLTVDTAGHWFMMQLGMIAGFATAWPVNRWLVCRGIKEKMDVRTHLADEVQRLLADADAPPARAADGDRVRVGRGKRTGS